MRTFLILALTYPAWATTYYMGPLGSDANSCATAQTITTPKLTWSSAKGCLSAGDTLTVRDGTYSGANNNWDGVPSGSAGNFVTFQAEHEGAVIWTGTLMPNTTTDHADHYIQIIGMRWESTNQKIVVGNHIKFFRTGFQGGPPNGNTVNTSVGTNDFSDTADILFEDCWWYGLGGRYKLIIYSVQRAVCRRCIFRNDGGWDYSGGSNPEASMAFYDTSDTWCENCLVIDSNLGTYSPGWSGASYMVHNGTTSNTGANDGSLGGIWLNSSSYCIQFDGLQPPMPNFTLTDSVVVDCTSGGVAFQSGTSATGAVNRLTVMMAQIAADSGNLGGFITGGGPISNINMIVANFDAGAFGDTNSAVTFFDTFNNNHTQTGTGRVTYNPQSNGLLYLPRIEAASNLKTAGSSAGQIGAQIVNEIGTSGTFQGDTGWNTDTGLALWPWPNQVRIKQEMCTNVSITRGFCGDTSLTNYIWNYLGNGCPVCVVPSGTSTTTTGSFTGTIR